MKNKVIIRKDNIFLDLESIKLSSIYSKKRYLKFPYEEKSVVDHRESLGKADKEEIDVYFFILGDKDDSFTATYLDKKSANAAWQKYLNRIVKAAKC